MMMLFDFRYKTDGIAYLTLPERIGITISCRSSDSGDFLGLRNGCKVQYPYSQPALQPIAPNTKFKNFTTYKIYF